MPISTSTLPLLRTSLESLLSRTKCTRFIVHWDLSSPHLSPPSVSIHTSPFLLSSRQRRDDAIEDTSLFHRDRSRLPNLLVIQPGIRPDTLLQAKLSEALNLAKSLEEQRDGFYNTEFSEKKLPPHVVVQNPAVRSVSADTYFGKGTVQNVNCHLNALESQDELDAVFVNAILSGIQQRNLERIWGKPVLDRVALIIEIFNAHAQTKEAKLQAELAALMYKKTRLVRLRGRKGRCTFGEAGLSEVVSARGRSSGGRGFISGAGETELQLQRRRILERRNHLLTEIEEVRRTRAVQRAGRRRHGGTHGEGLATVAIVGYTNAGKSTLVNALSDSDLYSDDRMFATVDPRLRSIILPSGRKVLLSDTVGFISDLPVQLVEAFHATLEEVVEADLLVHVLDSSAPDPEEHRSTVLRVLKQIGVSEEKLNNMIEVWNKVDLQENAIGVNERVDMVCELSSDSEDNGARCISESENSGGAVECHDGNNRHNEGLITDLVGCSSVGFRDSETGSRIVGPQVENVRHVKTSAVTGIGLQELLVLVDEKLNGRGEGELGKTVFDRKWRPLQTKSAAVRG